MKNTNTNGKTNGNTNTNTNNGNTNGNTITVWASGKVEYNVNLNTGVKTANLLKTKYKGYLDKVAKSNEKREGDKQITPKNFNDFAVNILHQISARITLTLNLAEKSADEKMTMDKSKFNQKNINNLEHAMKNYIEFYIENGYITVSEKSFLVFGTSYSIDNKIFYMFNSVSEFSRMVKRDGHNKVSDFIGKGFNLNIK